MPTYLTPGVYFEPVDRSREGLTAIRTDIPAFIGLAERGPLDQATAVHSWHQFQTRFGGYMAGAYLAYAVKAFFENGGQTCYIVRVAATDAQAASGVLVGRDGLPTLRIEASSAGTWGDALHIRLANGRSDATQTRRGASQETDGYSLRVQSVVGFRQGSLVRLFQANGGDLVEQYNMVATVDYHDRRLTWEEPLKLTPSFPGDPIFDLTDTIDLETDTFTLTVYEEGEIRAIYSDRTIIATHEQYVGQIVDTGQPLADDQLPPLVNVINLHESDPAPSDWSDWLPDVNATTADFNAGVLTLKGGKDGLANLEIIDFIGDMGESERIGLRVLELVDEVSLVAIPDILIQPTPPVQYAPLPEPPPPDPCLPGATEKISAVSMLTAVEQPPQFSTSQIYIVQQAIIDHCESQRNRIALLDPLPPPANGIFDPSEVLNWRQQFDTSFALLSLGDGA